MKWSGVPKVLLASANMSAMILYIVTNAVLFSFLMTSEQIPQAMADWITGSGIGWITFLLAHEPASASCRQRDGAVVDHAHHGADLIPIAVKLGIDPVHFGIILVVNMEIGMCHPPVGLNLFVASGIAKDGHDRTFDCRIALADHVVGVPRANYLHPRNVALAAARARHALVNYFYES